MFLTVDLYPCLKSVVENVLKFTRNLFDSSLCEDLKIVTFQNYICSIQIDKKFSLKKEENTIHASKMSHSQGET